MDWVGGGWTMMVLWWIILIGVMYLFVRAVRGPASHDVKQDSALEILKKRYARGEISKEEFDSKKKDIT